MRCCSYAGYEDVFAEKLARKDARRYRTRGLKGSARRILEAARARGVDGAEVLEIGGGVGAIQLELLAAGAARATNTELSPSYEREAAALAAERGVADRTSRVLGDLVEEPELAGAADLVVLERVVCCYPDADALVRAAASRARRLLVLSYPRPGTPARAFAAAANLVLRLRRDSFRVYVHPAATIRAAAAGEGLAPVGEETGLVWRVAAFTRT
jgi:magnesium-protoporphyrin O-methyltransferase